MGAVGLILVLIVVFCGIFGPWITPFDPFKINVPDKFQPPSFTHLMGTDNLGRDVFSRVIAGSRIALTVGISTIAIALVLGLILGLVAGYGPRWLDNLLMLIFDSIYSFPTVILGLTVVTLLGASVTTLVLVVIVIQTPAYARLTRTATLSLKNSEYIQAIESLGASKLRIIFVHILPNVVGPLLIIASMDIPSVVALEAGLTYLGMGIPPPAPSWGRILQEGYSLIRVAPWIVVAGGIPLIITTLGFTFLGESLRDMLDPKLRRMRMMAPVLDIRTCRSTSSTAGPPAHVLRDVNLSVPRGEIVGIVGESGSGKSTLALAFMRPPVRQRIRHGGQIMLGDVDLLALPPAGLREIRGRRVTMVFQDPMTSLNPVRSIGKQMIDIQYRDKSASIEDKRRKAAAALTRVGIPDADVAARQLSLPVLRRHAPAHRHRHEPAAAARAAHRRRGDDRARRHARGADPAPAA